MTTITDPFTRSNGGLGANYTRGQGTASTLSVSSNACAVAANSSDAYELYTAASFGDDQEAGITIGSSVAVNARYAQVCARGSGQDSTFKAYVTLTDGTSGADHTEIGQITAGSYSRLKAVSTTFSTGNKIGIRVTGSNPVLIELLKDTGSGYVVIDSYSDSAGSRISSGGTIGPGGYNSGGTLTLDDFAGGDVDTGDAGDAEGAGVENGASAPEGSASVGVTASGAGVEGEATAPDATAESITVRITGFRLINKAGAPVTNLSDVPALIYKEVPSSAVAPDKHLLCSTNGSGILADIDISDIQSDGSDVWLTLMLDGSPPKGTTVKVTPTVID